MSKITTKPLNDRVIVKAENADNKTASGLYIPDGAKEKPNKAEVIAVGPNVEEVEVGDIIHYGKFTGSDITIDKVDYLIMREADILAKD